MTLTARVVIGGLALVWLSACRRGASGDEEREALASGPAAAGAATIVLTPRALAATQVETQMATVTTVPETFATTGQVAFDPSRIVVVSAPVAGRAAYIARNVGERVAAGDTLVTFASPEFLTGRFGVTAPQAGVVTALAVAPEQVVTPGAEVIRLASIGRVWLNVDFYGERARFARVGTRVAASVSYLPGRWFSGRIASVAPSAEGPTQSAVAHVPLDNPGERLLPGMFADVRIETGRAVRGILIPGASVIYDGGRRLVMIRQDTTFFPAVIEIGPVVGDRVVVVRGIRPGEQVVVRGGYELYGAGYAFVREAEESGR